MDFSSTISRSGLFPRYSSHVNTHSMTQFHDRLLTKSDYTSYCCVRNNFWHYEPYMTLLQMMHYNQCSFDIIISVRLKLGQIIWCTNDQSSLTIEHMPVIIWVSFRCRNAESKTTEGHDGKIYKVFYLAFTHSCYQKHLTFFYVVHNLWLFTMLKGHYYWIYIDCFCVSSYSSSRFSQRNILVQDLVNTSHCMIVFSSASFSLHDWIKAGMSLRLWWRRSHHCRWRKCTWVHFALSVHTLWWRQYWLHSFRNEWFAKIMWFIDRYGRSPTRYDGDALAATPIFCADCFDHASTLIMHNANADSSRKRKRFHDASVHDAELIQTPQQHHADFFDTRKPHML